MPIPFETQKRIVHKLIDQARPYARELVDYDDFENSLRHQLLDILAVQGITSTETEVNNLVAVVMSEMLLEAQTLSAIGRSIQDIDPDEIQHIKEQVSRTLEVPFPTQTTWSEMRQFIARQVRSAIQLNELDVKEPEILILLLTDELLEEMTVSI